MNFTYVLLGLQSLYEALNGRYWVYQGAGPEWSFDNLEVNPCDPPWQLLHCSDGQLDQLLIRYANASGRLEAAIGFFDNQYMRENITILLLHSNRISGPVPSSLYMLTGLTRIEMYDNQFTGSFPEEFMGRLENLDFFSINNNKLTGPFPASFNDLPILSTLDISSNFLTGPLPPLSMVQLIVLNLGNNSLNSSLPYMFLPHVQQLILNNNIFSGSLGSVGIEIMFDLEDLILYQNKFTSTLPPTIAYCSNLVSLSLSSNEFTGNLDILTNLRNLREIRLFDNNFNGPISPGFENLTQMTLFDVHNNSLSGSIVTSIFSGMQNLENVSLSSNRFTGPFPNFIANKKLISVSVTDNLFTGYLPAALFENNTNLMTFAASKNCLHREFPASICEAVNLKDLYLSGLRQLNCRNYFFFDHLVSHDVVPPCLWSMINMRELYLDGNKYIFEFSTFGMDFQMNNLTHFSIGSNRFRGSLPVQLNDRVMELFDVSNNEITGDLLNANIKPASSSATFNAFNNRFSGELHTATLEDYNQGINVLEGNVFTCGDLPSNDLHEQTYICGSRDYEYAIIIWSASLFVFLCVIAIYSRSEHPKVRDLRLLLTRQCDISLMSSDDVKSKFPHATQLLVTLERMALMGLAIVSFQVVVEIAMFVGLKYGPFEETYRTHEYQYLYSVSGLFLKTWVPAILITISHHIIVIGLLVCMFRFFVTDWNLFKFCNARIDRNRILESRRIGWSQFKEMTSGERMYQVRKNLYRVFVAGLYILISGGANVAYIALKSRINNFWVIMLQLFAVIYYNVSRLLTPAIRNHLFTSITETGGLHTNVSIWTSSLMLVIIDYLVPFAATIFSDYSCFYELIIGTTTVTSTISSSACLVYFNKTQDCAVAQESTEVVNFQPPFMYSHQCRYTIYGVLCTAQLILLHYISTSTYRNAVLLNYVPIVIIASALESFFIPILYIVLTKDITDISAPVTFFGGRISLSNTRDIVLSDVSFFMMRIWMCFLALLTYGMFSPAGQ